MKENTHDRVLAQLRKLVPALVPLMLAGCGGSPTSPSASGPPLAVRHSTTHFDFAWADPDLFTVHTIWPIDNHEVIHLYTSTIGRAPPLFNEGIAVAYQVDPVRGDFTPRWNNRHVHDVSAGWRRQHRLVPLGDLLTVDRWRAIDSQIAYPQAGSFVRYLIDSRGVDSIKALLRRSTHLDAADVTRRNAEAVFGATLDALEAEWLAMIDRRGSTP